MSKCVFSKSGQYFSVELGESVRPSADALQTVDVPGFSNPGKFVTVSQLPLLDYEI